MPRPDEVSNASELMPMEIIGLRMTHYSIPPALAKNQTNVAPVVAVSVDEKVADLIQHYPYLEALLKTHAKDASARIRDLAISDKEREQLMFQIISARRKQVMDSGDGGAASATARGASKFRFGSYARRRKKVAQ